MALDLSSPCPACSRRFSLRLLLELESLNRFGIIDHPVGVVCPGCGLKLQVKQWRAAVVGPLSGFAIAAVAGIAFRALKLQMPVAIAAAILLVAVWLYSGKYLWALAVRLVPREGGGVVDFPIERLKQELALVAEDADEAPASMLRAAAEHWLCAKCGEPNPGDSGLCLNCGR